MPVKLTAAVEAELQTTWLAGSSTVGVGLTVIVNCCVEPEQSVPPPEKTGVTIIVALIAALVPFVAEKAAMFPEPEAARPIAMLSLVQV